MKDSKKLNPVLEEAQKDVDQSRQKLEAALTHLEEKVEENTIKVQDFIHKAKAPIRFARNHPYANAAVFLAAGFAIGGLLSSRWFKGSSQDRFERDIAYLDSPGFERVTRGF